MRRERIQRAKGHSEGKSEAAKFHAADQVLFLSLLVVYTGVMLYLFVMQCYEVPVFRSDMPDYVNKVRGIAGDYEFPYPLFFTLAKVFALVGGAPMGVAITTALLNSLGVCFVNHYIF